MSFSPTATLAIEAQGSWLHRGAVALLLGCVLMLSACTYADANHAVALGGKGAYKGKSFGVTWDNEASFRDGAVLATAAVGAWANVASTKAAELTTQVKDANATKTAINASNNAVKTAEIGAGVTKATTLNPNVIPK